MREGWRNLKLSEVLKLEYGKPLPAERRADDGEFPAYGANGVKCRTNDVYWEEASIVVGRKGSAGEINLVDGGFWPLDVTYFVVFDNDEYELKFLYYLLSRLNLSSLSKGVKPGLNRNDVYAIKQWFPALPEQKRIVAILDEVFAATATATANTKKNLDNARELFESQLNAVFAQQDGVWVEKTLRQVSTQFGRGKSRHRPRNAKKLYGGKYPFIQTGDIRNSDHLITAHIQTYSELGLAQSKLWPKGTVCITIAANIAETGVLEFDACIPDSVIGLVADPRETDGMFVEYLLQSFKVDLQAKGKGSAQANINMGTFKDLLFPFPNIETQQAIVAKLDALAAMARQLASLYQHKIRFLTELKQSILHKAFTGELTKISKRIAI